MRDPLELNELVELCRGSIAKLDKLVERLTVVQLHMRRDGNGTLAGQPTSKTRAKATGLQKLCASTPQHGISWDEMQLYAVSR